MERVVVVGASLAGSHAAEALRDEGFDGQIVLLGDEPDAPYDRPPLSKQILTQTWDEDRIELFSLDELSDLDIELRMSSRAVGLDTGARIVRLESGEELGYDGLIIATGARARQLSGPSDPHIHVLRDLGDARRLSQALAGGSRRLGIVGGGFIGSEVAHGALTLGNRVTVFEQGPSPMSRVFGAQVGARLAALQHRFEVDLRTEVAVDAVRPNVDGGVDVTLTDGTTHRFDDVLVSIGAIPNTEWLTGSALDVDAGLVCDSTLFAAPGIVGAGDIVRIRDAEGRLHRRIEHWTDSVAQAQAAAANLIVGAANARPFSGLPYVWSDQFGLRIEVIGDPTLGELSDVQHGPTGDDGISGAFRYTRGDDTVAVVSIGLPSVVQTIRRTATSMSALAPVRLEQMATVSPASEGNPS